MPFICFMKPKVNVRKRSFIHKQYCFFSSEFGIYGKITVLQNVILDEPFELLGVVRTAVVGGPGVADGELVKLEHVHDADLGHGAAEQVRALVHTHSWWNNERRNK